jgi:hypothetical protein
MTREKNSTNGLLNEAIALLIQNEAALLPQQLESNRPIAEAKRQMAETDRRNAETFARLEARLRNMEAILAEHSSMLAELVRLMQAMPEAICEKIGFRGQEKPSPAL